MAFESFALGGKAILKMVVDGSGGGGRAHGDSRARPDSGGKRGRGEAEARGGGQAFRQTDRRSRVRRAVPRRESRGEAFGRPEGGARPRGREAAGEGRNTNAHVDHPSSEVGPGVG